MRLCDLNPARSAASLTAFVLIGFEFAGTQITACSIFTPVSSYTDTLKSFKTSAESSSGNITRDDFSNLNGMEKPILCLNSVTALLSFFNIASFAFTPTSTVSASSTKTADGVKSSPVL